MIGGPISDRRLVSHEDGGVTFSACVGKTHGGSDETEDVPLSGAEFVRRWAMHILPKGYTKTRRFGGYSNHHRKRYIAECRELLAIIVPVANRTNVLCCCDDFIEILLCRLEQMSQSFSGHSC